MKNDTRILWVVILLAVLMWLVYRLAPVITPFAMAAALAYLGDPLVDRLQRVTIRDWTCGRTLAVSIVFLLMILLIFGFLLIVIPNTLEQIRRLIERIPMIAAWFANTAIPWVESRLGVTFPDMDAASITATIKTYWREVGAASVNVLGSVSAGGQAVANWLMNFVLVPVVTFYLLRDWDALLAGVRKLLPPAIEPTVSDLAREINGVLGAFIRGQFMVMLALGLIYTCGLLVIGMDLAFAIGMLAGILSIVPYLGTLVGVVAALVASVFQFQDFIHPLLALAVFGIGQTLEGMVLTPKLVGDKVGLHPVAVIFAVLAGGQLFGFLGILLALPVAAALNVLLRFADAQYRSSHWFHVPQAEDTQAAAGEAVTEVKSGDTH
ncbi:MAG TPA: AI-2E family transporter [Xanthomonadales bacterium]|nr:AI-2E family transporter [Xanthomonadales bacterium]